MATVPLSVVRPSWTSAEAEHDGPEVRVLRSCRRPPVVTTTALSHVDDPDDVLAEVEAEDELELTLVLDSLVVLAACAVAGPPPARGGSVDATAHPPIATGAITASMRGTVVVVSFMGSLCDATG